MKAVHCAIFLSAGRRILSKQFTVKTANCVGDNPLKESLASVCGANVNRNIFVLALISVLMMFGSSREACGQTSEARRAARPASQDVVVPSDMEIDLLRKDLRSQKKQIIAANMKLTDKEAEKFWPLYDEYTTETIKINDTKYQLIQGYAQNYDQMTAEQAEQYVRGLVAVDQSTSQLRLTYWPKFRNVISAKSTALFFQLDRRLTMLIDVQLASQIPLLQP